MNEQERLMYARFEMSNRRPWLIDLPMKYGLVKTEGQAIYALIAAMVVAVLITLWSFGAFGLTSHSSKVAGIRFGDTIVRYQEDLATLPDSERRSIPPSVQRALPHKPQ
jgi:hypothetical protein